MKKYNTYVDEAGQTGFNIWDWKTQPFFVLAGVTIDEESSNLANDVKGIFDAHKQYNQKEFKTHNWLKYPKRRSCVFNMFQHICQHAIDVNIVVIEKKFMIAALIIHKFFDGAYNDFDDYTWVNDKSERLKAANYYYELLNDNDLFEIGKGLMHPEEESLKIIWDILWQNTTKPEYKRVLVGVEDHLDEIISEFSAIVLEDCNLCEAITNSPNFTAFAQLGNMIAINTIQNNYSTRLIFDDCPSCNKEFTYIFNLFQNDSISDALIPMFGLCSWKNRVTDFSIGGSENDYNLQVADVVASLVFYVFKNILNDTLPANFDKSIITQMQTMKTNGKLWDVTSNRFMMKFMNDY